MERILIDRVKITPTPGTNYRLAFTYVYKIIVPASLALYGVTEFTGSGLGWARRFAKKLAGDQFAIVETWHE